MDPTTIRHYDAAAHGLADRYESASVSELHHILLQHLSEHARLLEIGCGSGRDAAFLLHQGFDVTAMDASAGMLAEAGRRHPELRGRLRHAAFPLRSEDALLDQRFDAIVSVAAVMHISNTDLAVCATQWQGMLSPHGVVIVSSSTGREDVQGQREDNGRLFVERSPDELESIFQSSGFQRAALYENVDGAGRPFRWYSLVLICPSS